MLDEFLLTHVLVIALDYADTIAFCFTEEQKKLPLGLR